jgi:hypothetical protein
MNNLPIPTIAKKEKSQLAALAKQCADATASRDSASLSAFENEINQIVYRLFDLTPEEIALIEASLAT